MTTQNTTKTTWIEWGNTQFVTENIMTLDALKASGYVERHASNFGYNHLIAKEFVRMEKMEISNFYITKADPKFNYGLDFKMWMLYKTDGGMQFMREITLGGSSITSAPLQRVSLNKLMPVGLDFDNQETATPELLNEFFENAKTKTLQSFDFSMNVGYKKDAKYREELRRMCKEMDFIFA